jgi:AcrR family transcriptional regulator
VVWAILLPVFTGILSYQNFFGLNMTEHKDYSLQNRRQTLLSAAEDLFAKHGFDGTSIRMISKELGVNSAMISYYFGSKEALYLQIFRNRLYEIAEEISRFDQLGLGPVQKIEAYLAVYINRISSNKSFHRLLYNQLVTGQYPAIISMVSEARAQIYSFLLKIIKDGILSGHFNVTDAEMFALNILSFIPSVFTGNLLSLIHLGEPMRDDFARRMIDHIMQMVIPSGVQSNNKLCHV